MNACKQHMIAHDLQSMQIDRFWSYFANQLELQDRRKEFEEGHQESLVDYEDQSILIIIVQLFIFFYAIPETLELSRH